jgi:hypothetical protein
MVASQMNIKCPVCYGVQKTNLTKKISSTRRKPIHCPCGAELYIHPVLFNRHVLIMGLIPLVLFPYAIIKFGFILGSFVFIGMGALIILLGYFFIPLRVKREKYNQQASP